MPSGRTETVRFGISWRRIIPSPRLRLRLPAGALATLSQVTLDESVLRLRHFPKIDAGGADVVGIGQELRLCLAGRGARAYRSNEGVCEDSLTFVSEEEVEHFLPICLLRSFIHQAHYVGNDQSALFRNDEAGVDLVLVLRAVGVEVIVDKDRDFARDYARVCASGLKSSGPGCSHRREAGRGRDHEWTSLTPKPPSAPESVLSIAMHRSGSEHSLNRGSPELRAPDCGSGSIWEASAPRPRCRRSPRAPRYPTPACHPKPFIHRVPPWKALPWRHGRPRCHPAAAILGHC